MGPKGPAWPKAMLTQKAKSQQITKLEVGLEQGGPRMGLIMRNPGSVSSSHVSICLPE